MVVAVGEGPSLDDPDLEGRKVAGTDDAQLRLRAFVRRCARLTDEVETRAPVGIERMVVGQRDPLHLGTRGKDLAHRSFEAHRLCERPRGARRRRQIGRTNVLNREAKVARLEPTQ